MKSFVLSVVIVFFAVVTDGWKIFERVKFVSKYSSFYNEFFLHPQFDPATREHEGHEIELKGYYVPFDLENANSIVVSKYPYASCFFCGGAGPESVAEVNFKTKKPRLKADQIITVRGKLKLNDKDVNQMSFILENATMVRE
jgi:hypothetical protein